MILTCNLEIPDATTIFLEPPIRRAFFIANNPEICSTAFDKWNVTENDVIVQYNNPLFFANLAHYYCNKVQMNSLCTFDSCWGFTPEGHPEIDYCNQQYRSLTFVVVGSIPSVIKAYFEGMTDRAKFMSISDLSIPLYSTIVDSKTLAHGYPAGKKPSAGFSSLNFFRFVNWLRQSRGCERIELFMIGFTGVYKSGNPWVGHDFLYEQQVYNIWLELHRLGFDGTEETSIRQRTSELNLSPSPGRRATVTQHGVAVCEDARH